MVFYIWASPILVALPQETSQCSFLKDYLQGCGYKKITQANINSVMLIIKIELS